MKRFFTTLSAIVFCALFTSAVAFGASTTVVISQVYGGGGGSTTNTFKKDFVELKNVSDVPQSLSGLSLMYGSATGQFGSSATNIIALNAVTLQPGQFYLVLLGGAGTAGADITNFDQTTTNLTMSGTAGKVALTNGLAPASCGATATPCVLPNPQIVDLVSYGTANNGEGGVSIPATSITTAGVRKVTGCQDTDVNPADFDVLTATVPNYTGSARTTCVPLNITTVNTMPNGALGVAYTTNFSCSGGAGPYTYAITGGAAPTGLTLNTNGTWSGTPSLAGTFNFSVTATDSNPFAFANATEIKNPFTRFAPNSTTEAFSIMIPAAPTASTATVRGRVVNESGRGLARAAISVLDTQTGLTIYARTNQLGYFTIADLPVGNFYVMQTQRKGYTFAETTSFQLFEDVEGLVITGTQN